MQRERHDVTATITDGFSRRREVRLEAPPQLLVSAAAVPGVLRLRDLSTSGMCLVADVPLPLNSVQTVTLRLGHISVTQKAQILHCRHRPQGGWQMGMRFVGPSSNDEWSIVDLVNLVLTTSIAFY